MPGPRSETGRDIEFDRPVFILSPPRSGSTLLFETLARAPGVYTIGGESHRIFESVPTLHPEGCRKSIRLGEQAAGLLEEGGAVAGQADTPRRALHQPRSEVLFEQTDEPPESRRQHL